MTNDEALVAAQLAAGQPNTSDIPPPPPIVGGDHLAEVIEHLHCGVPFTPPDGMLEYLIDLNTRGMKTPFRKFAEISTLTTFGGLLGRKYKTADGLSSALMSLLAAPTSSGKGEAFRFWPKQFARLTTKTDRPPNFYTGTAASAQGLHGKIQETGTTVWVREDASGDIANLASPFGQTQIELRDYIYELFDASTYGASPMMPVASVESKRRGDTPIHNATVAPLWSMTPEAFSGVYNHEVLATGLGSRMLVTVHDAPAGDAVPDDKVLHDLHGATYEMMSSMISEVAEIDAGYEPKSAPRAAEMLQRLVRVPYHPDAAALLWCIEQAVNNIRRGVNNKKLPPHYAVFGRTAMQTKKIALVSALVRNRFKCRIERHDVAYALRYAVNALGSLAAMFDNGQVGAADDRARQAAIVEWFRNNLGESNHPRITPEMKTTMTAPLWWLTSRAQRNNAFKQHRNGANAALIATLDMMINSGALERQDKGFRVVDLGILN